MEGIKISLAAARVNAKMTQKEVAKALRVSTNSVVNWEKGSASPSFATLSELCRLYAIPVDNIFLPQEST